MATRIFHAAAPLHQDYSDDGEWGGARKILDALKLAGIFNVAIFVVRYHNGPNLGPRRFEIIESMAKDVIADYPGVLDYGQSCGAADPMLLDILKKVANTSSKNTTRYKSYNRFCGRGGVKTRGDIGAI